MPDSDLPLPTPDPGELLARAMHTDPPSGEAGGGRWTPPTPEELAAILPQYRIESLLGHGGMGAVYRGVQTALDRPVAIKLLPLEISADRDFADRFVREARTLAKLSHPNIVAVHDFGTTTAGHLYFVMEFVEGTNLHQMIHGPGLTPAQALSIIISVCEALQYAHGKGVVHRDIKPANIMVSTESQVKVADFGLARLNNPDTENWGHTMTGTVMGTPDYMAPEQTRGMAVDHRADIYSLGVMLYEMLCGEVPRGVFEPPSRKVQVDVRVDEVVLKAMQSEPERRYQNTVEMKTDVDHIRTTPEPPRPAPKPKRKAPIAAVIAACLALASAAGFFIWEKVNRPREAGAFPGRVGVPPADAGVPPGSSKKENASSGTDAPSPSGVVRETRTTAGGTPTLPGNITPAAATKDAPFVNTLGMKFVPVPITGGPTGGQRVLFSVWETRHQDMAAFAKDTQNSEIVARIGRKALTDPTTAANWEDATAFCAWLTARERETGKLGANERYRLPSDHEWSCAAGIGEREDPAQIPAEKSAKNADIFPWGGAWPPPAGVANYAGDENRAHIGVASSPFNVAGFIEGYTDGFAGSSRFGSFPANTFGLHDLSGNLSEMCEDWVDGAKRFRVLRGGNWGSHGRKSLTTAYRESADQKVSTRFNGFRVVLAPVAAGAASGPVHIAPPSPAKWEEAIAPGPKRASGPFVAEGDWLMSPTPQQLGGEWTAKEFANVAMRARYRKGIQLKFDPRAADGRRYSFVIGDAASILAGTQAKMVSLAHQRPLPPGYAADAEHEAVAVAHGDALLLWVDGTLVATAREPARPRVTTSGHTWVAGAAIKSLEIGELNTPLAPAILAAAFPAAGSAAPAEEKWVDARQDATFAKGNYMLKPGEGRWTVTAQGATAINDSQCRDGAVRMRAPFDARENVGLIIRSGGVPNSFYRSSVLLGGDEVGLNFHRGGTIARALNNSGDALVKRKLPKPLQPGEEYELEVRGVGDLFTVRLNGTVLLENRDSNRDSGKAGIAFGATGKERTITALEYLILDGSASAAQPPQPGGGVQTFGGHRYQLVKAREITWDAAKAKAEAMGGHLATFTSEVEEDFVRDQFLKPLGKTDEKYWIGGYAEAGSRPMQWVTGEAFGKVRWTGGNPDWRESGTSGDAKNHGGPLFRAGVAVGAVDWNGNWVGISPAAFKNWGFLVEWDTESDTGIPPVKPAPPTGATPVSPSGR